MKTREIHTTTLGRFAPVHASDSSGHITFHDSPRYGRATAAQLELWADSRLAAVRAAAEIELAERRVAAWRAR